MKRLRTDHRGEEIFKPFLFVIVFIVAMIVLLGAWAAEEPKYTGGTGNAIIGGVYYTWYDPVAGYPMSWANVTDSYDPWPNDKTVEYDDDGVIYSATVVRNSTELGSTDYWWNDEWAKYSDFIGIEHTGVEYWIFPYTDRIALPLDLFNTSHSQAQFVNTNSSVINFVLGASNLTLAITTSGYAANFSTDLYGMNWAAMNLGQSLAAEMEETASAAWWNIAFQLLTFSLPDVPWVFAVLISGIIWAAIGFLIFVIATRILHGGG